MYPDDFMPKLYPQYTEEEEDEEFPASKIALPNLSLSVKLVKPTGGLLILENVDVRGISQVDDSGFAPGLGMRSHSGIPEHHLDFPRNNEEIRPPPLPEQNEDEEEEEEDAVEDEEEDEEYYEEEPQIQNNDPTSFQVEDHK